MEYVIIQRTSGRTDLEMKIVREKREIYQSDKGKWCLRQKKTIEIKKNKWKQTHLQDQGFFVPPASSGTAQRTHT